MIDSTLVQNERTDPASTLYTSDLVPKWQSDPVILVLVQCPYLQKKNNNILLIDWSRCKKVMKFTGTDANSQF
jgi:hypothetical protein